MNVVEIEFQPGGLGLVFDDGISANGKLEIISGVLEMTGLSAAQRVALLAFNSNIDVSVPSHDARFGSGTGIGIFNVVEDLAPQLGRHLDLNGYNIYDDSGDARGLDAFDFQLLRNNNSEVASGKYSFIAAGRYNTASGDGSYAEGDANVASGRYSYVEGSYNVSSGRAAHSEGYNNTASGGVAHAEGENNIASANWAHAEGYRTRASGQVSHAEGSYTEASGRTAFAANYGNLASGEAARATGILSIASKIAQRAFASGAFARQGDAQNAETLARITSTDTNWTELYLDGASGLHQFTLSDDSFYSLRIMIGGFREGTNLGCMFMRMLTMECSGGVATILGEEVIGTDISPGGGTFGYFDVRLRAIGNRLSIQGKYDDGGTPKSIRWMAHIDSLEVLNPALASPSVSPSISISPSPSISLSPSPSISFSHSPSSSVSLSPSVSISPSPSVSQFSVSISPSPSMSLSPSLSMSISPSPSPTVPP